MIKNKRTIICISVILSLVILIAYGAFVKNSKYLFQQYYDMQLNNYSNIVKKTIEISDDYTHLVDKSVGDDLFRRISSLHNDFKDTPLSHIDSNVLKIARIEHGFFGVAIFAQDSDGIYVYESTIADEVGERTRNWGFWNTAFQNLFDGKSVSVKEGLAYERCWVGPRSKSYYEPGFIRYAYYYNEKQGYLINAFVKDENVYGEKVKNVLEGFFEHLCKDVSYIEGAILIDLMAWEKAYYNDYKNRESPAFLYGNFDGKQYLIHSGLTPENLFSIEENESITFKYNGESKTLFMISVGKEEEPHLVAILLDDHETEHFIRHILFRFMILLFFTLSIIIAAIFYIVNEYRTLLTFQIERNKEIERFSKNVAMIPEITYKCKYKNDKLLLAFIYGKAMHGIHKVSLDSDYFSPMEIYDDSYAKDFEGQITPVFEGKSRRFEISYKDAHYEHFVSPIINEDGTISEIIGIANNITNRKIEEEQAKYFASHDFLTHILNRKAFEEEVVEQANSATNAPFAIMLIDLDDFKSVNDIYGHIAGDIVLKKVASLIQKVVNSKSPSAVVARMGGDEFTALVPYEILQDIIDIASEIVHAISNPLMVDEMPTQIGASIGISLYPTDSSTYGDLLYNADMAMYNIKRKGGNGYQFFTPEMRLQS